ncbi:hypothetical protein AQ915_20670 [Burkholderia pseudomallei]|uniref:type II toxin-antitoxin system RelE/ParE family toxin n=1 Tax=Burkholderia pseudomallei TaxID=28450 RepID=UPI000978621C|nr:type II toxin-antitoxin system RelE/ParE family toxin [Burkholderia pseudomallei]ONC30069.1 hypothetical protein AQ915_20670 [Burkholderia pseudomallei]
MIQVEFARSFDVRLTFLEDFMMAQDRDSAERRMDALWDEIREVHRLLRMYPGIGRPFNVSLDDREEESPSLQILRQSALEQGLPEIREIPLRAHVIIYAHNDARALVLSIRHHREIGY